MQTTDVTFFRTVKHCLATLGNAKRPEGYPCQPHGHEALSAQRLSATDGAFTGLSTDTKENQFSPFTLELLVYT